MIGFAEPRSRKTVPLLEDYGVSPITGFLPEELPLARLPREFDAWEDLVADLPALVLAGRIRECVESLPPLSAGKLHNVREQRRAYSVLGFLAHAYIWSPPKACDHVPKVLADPLLTLSERLGVPPLATFAGLCLWNFRALDQVAASHWDLTNLATTLTFTGATDESWFYLISIALEKQGGPCLANGVGALLACQAGDVDGVISRLDRLARDIDEMTAIFMRMPENLDPHFFYHRLRPYLAGSKGMESAGLPLGVRYGDETEYRQYCGGSNGQSSLVQALDILLGVEHHALGHRQPPLPISKATAATNTASTKPDEKKNSPFLIEMRQYMPKEHRQFLIELENCAILRPFVMQNADTDPGLVRAYDGCLKALREFRSKHIQIVMRYISLPARGAKKGVGLSSSNGETGTGGTELMPFLKQSRDEVSDVAAGNWSRNIMSSKKY